MKDKFNPKITERRVIMNGVDSMGRTGRIIYEPWGEETISDFKKMYPKNRSSFKKADIEICVKWGVEFDVVDKDGNLVERITGC